MTEKTNGQYVITDEELAQYALLWAEAHSADMDSIGKVRVRATKFEEDIRSRPLSEEILKAREDVLDELIAWLEPQSLPLLKQKMYRKLKSLREGAP